MQSCCSAAAAAAADADDDDEAQIAVDVGWYSNRNTKLPVYYVTGLYTGIVPEQTKTVLLLFGLWDMAVADGLVTVKAVKEWRLTHVGPRLWNSLPDDITSAQSLPVFRKKT